MQPVADVILAQLGGRRFEAMTGAKDFSRSHIDLQFKLPQTKQGRGLHFTVRLCRNDTYELKLQRIKVNRMVSVTELETRGNVYVENLRETFEDMTGLLTSL
jgi:hypothetical protein